ncbi:MULTISPECIES: hypothetical protein [unclassified Streptomyces]|uniref:hypothetical protein n=1 Tax=unclassified Streptomyces TaxID=2593676 RepID=UPI001319E27C|nr:MULTISPECIES: hypothetical protein [unclassified Streptomyces]MYT33416.1 hypothetical protein [Streptomyces sp. SID8354]
MIGGKEPGAERCAVAEAVARRRPAELDGRIARLSRVRAGLAARLGEPADRPGGPARGDRSLTG